MPNNGSCHKDCQTRIGQASSVPGRLKSVWKNKHISLALTVRLCVSNNVNNAVQSGVVADVIHTKETRSSAVAERPHDASCLSVVSCNISVVQFFITSYCGFRFTSA